MVITYHGAGSFKVQSGNTSIVVDPISERLKPDVFLKTATPFPADTTEANEVSGPGEYEIKEVSIKGIQLLEESTPKLIKTAYAVTVEHITLGFLGEIAKMPDAEFSEKLGNIDILILPVGKPYLDAESAAKLVKQIDPRIVIPSFTKNPKDFFEELGQKAESSDKLTIKKKELMEMGNTIKAMWLKD